MVLRFLPTDDTAECETCEGTGGWSCCIDVDGVPRHWTDCLDCTNGRRPFRAGDRIAIRADDNMPERGIVGGFEVFEHFDGSRFMRPVATRYDDDTSIPLRPGDIVGYATVTNVLPIVENIDSVPLSEDAIEVSGRNVVTVRCWVADAQNHGLLSDHIDAGLVFTPGQAALELAVYLADRAEGITP